MMLMRLPRQMRESVDQGGGEDQPLVVEGVEGVEAVAHFTDLTQLFQRDVVFLTELFQFHRFSPFFIWMIKTVHIYCNWGPHTVYFPALDQILSSCILQTLFPHKNNSDISSFLFLG